MSYLVTNCFHWVGFHVVNRLLNEGHHVVGFDEMTSNKEENLSMFFGRNDLFSLNPSKLDDEKTFEGAILVDSSSQNIAFQSDCTIRLSYDRPSQKESGITTIKLPLLFGKWMEMNDNGLYNNGTFIQFDSQRFMKEAIYIEDFIQCMMQMLKSAHLPSYLEIKSSENKETNDNKGEKSIFIRDDKPIEDNLKMVLAHYKRFHDLY